MNKKTKKQTQVLNQKIQKLSQQIAGARQMRDDSEIAKLEQELTAARAQLQKLKDEG